jgi:hypothetical protein
MACHIWAHMHTRALQEQQAPVTRKRRKNCTSFRLVAFLPSFLAIRFALTFAFLASSTSSSLSSSYTNALASKEKQKLTPLALHVCAKTKPTLRTWPDAAIARAWRIQSHMMAIRSTQMTTYTKEHTEHIGVISVYGSCSLCVCLSPRAGSQSVIRGQKKGQRGVKGQKLHKRGTLTARRASARACASCARRTYSSLVIPVSFC